MSQRGSRHLCRHRMLLCLCYILIARIGIGQVSVRQQLTHYHDDLAN